MAKQLNVNLSFTADVGKAKAQIQELQSLLNNIASSSFKTGANNDMTKKLAEASAAAKELQLHLNNAFNVKTGQFDLSALDKSLKASGSNIQNLSTKLLNAGETGQQAFMKLAQSISLADQPMLRINGRLKEFATTMKNTARWQLSSSMLHGFMGAVQSAYGYAQDLNKSLTDIRIVTGANADEMARFAENANKAAKNLNTTTNDYTKASLIYFQQGLDDAEVAARTNVTIKMANAAGQSAQIVSDQLTAIWNNFYDGSKSLEYYADVMTALGAATASSTDEIAGGLEKFAAIGQTIGLSYEYAAAALATITSNTRESEEVVGTALKTIFARIQGLNLGETLEDGVTLNKYSEALQKVGISIFDSNGELKKMDNILDELGAKWETLNKSQQVALAQTVAGVRQYNQLIALMDNWDRGDSDSMKANLNTAYGATGTLDKQAEIYAQSWEAAEKRVRAAAEGIYQSLLDDDFFIDLNNGFANLLGGLDLFIDKAGGLKTIILGVSSILLANFSSKIPTALNNLKINFGVIKDEIKAIASVSAKVPDSYERIHTQMQATTKEAFARQGIDENSSMGFMIDSSNKLAVARSKLAAMSDRMSQSEKQMAEMELSLIQSQQEEVYTLKQKNEELKKSIELQQESLSKQNVDSGFTSKAYKHEEDMTRRYQDLKDDEDGNAGDFASLDAFRKKYSSVIDEINTSISGMGEKMVNALVSGSTEAQDITSHLTKVAEAADLIQTNLSDLSLDEAKQEVAALRDVIPQSVREASGLEKAFRDIANATDENELEAGIKNLTTGLKDCKIPAEKLKDALKGIYGNQKIDQLAKDILTLSKNTKKAENDVTKLKRAITDFSPQHIVRTSEALGSLAGLAGNTVMVVNSLSSAIKSLADPDATGWEKLSAVLMTVSTVIPTTMYAFKSLGTIISFLNQQAATLGIVTATSTTAQRAAALAATLSATSHGMLTQRLTEEQIAKIASIATTERENGATREQIALKVQEYLVTNNIKTGKAAEVISRLAAKHAIDQENVSLKQALIAKGLDSAAMMIQNGHRVTGIILQTILNALTGDWASILKVLLVVIGLLIGGGLIAWLEAVIVTEKEALEAAENYAAKTSEAFDNVSESVRETEETLQKLGEQYKSIEKLTKGTLEWYKAVSDVNAMVMSLIDKYPELMQYVYQDDGILKITPEGQDALIDAQYERLQAAQNTKIRADIGLRELKLDQRAGDYDDANKFFKNKYQDDTVLALAELYNNPQFGQQMFTEAGSAKILEGLQLGDQTLDSRLLKGNRQALTREDYEKFYKDLIANEALIKEIATEQQYIQQMQDSLFANRVQATGTNRSLEEVKTMLGGVEYEDLFQSSRDKVESTFGDWNNHINYKKGGTYTTDAEWKMIEDFMNLQGDDVKYVAQRKGKMVLEVDGKEIEYTKDEVYDALAELYTGKELETRLTQSLTQTLGNSLKGVDLTGFDLDELIQLDNLSLAFDNALKGTAMEGQGTDLLNQVIAAKGSDPEALQGYLSSIQNLDLSNAENIRQFNAAALELAEGKITVDEFTRALDEMNAAAELDNMGAFFENAAEKYGMSSEDAENMHNYAKHLMEIAGESAELSDELETNADSAADLAVEITRMNKGVKKLADGFEDWKDVLSKSSRESAEYAEALWEMKDALSDVLDVEKDLISEDFVTRNMEQIQAASEGSAEAIDYLRSQMDEEIIQRVTVGQSESFQQDVMNLQNALFTELDRINTELPDIEVGAILQDEAFIAAANNLVDAASMTADEANAYFAGIGYEPVYNSEEIDTSTNVPNAQTTMAVQNIGWNKATMSIGDFNLPIALPNITYTTKSTPLDPSNAEGNMRLVSFSGDGKAPPIRGLRKKATGSSNNYSKNNSGGAPAKSPSKGGGGGSKEKEPSKPKKTDLTGQEEIVERYKEVNDSLDDLSDEYEKATRSADRLWGEHRLDAIREQNELIKEQQELLAEKQRQAERYMQQDRAALQKAAAEAGLAFSFDDKGNITNYTDQMTALYNQLANAEAHYNSLATGEEQDAYEETILGPLRDKISSIEDAMALYEESRELFESLGLEIDDLQDQIMQNNYDIIMEGLELHVSFNEEDLEVIDYYLSKLENDFYSMAEAAALMASPDGNSQLTEYISNLEEYENALQELNRAYVAGEITEAMYQKGLEEVRSGIRDNLSSLVELDQTMMGYYGETISMAQEELEKYTEQMEHQTEVLEHYHSLMETLGKETDYNALGIILEGQARTIENQVKVAKETYAMYQAEVDEKKRLLDEAIAAGNTDAAAIYQKEWEAANQAAMEAQQDMLDKTEEWAEALRAVLENKLSGFAQDLENALTGGTSFDTLTTSMERAASLQEEYLTTTNQIYETNKLMRTAQQAIDNSTSSIAKQKLKGFINETKQLQDQTKLSQYELEIQQAKYNLLLAEMALEDARDAKTVVRLKRDNEGNLGYVYTADQDKLAEAQQELEDAQNSLYNIGLEGANEYSEKYQQTMSEMYDTFTELQEQYLSGEFETEAEYQDAMLKAKEYYYEKLKNYSSLHQVALTTDSRVIADAWSSDYSEMIFNTEDWMRAVTEYVGNVNLAFDEWEANVETITNETLGPNLDALEDNVKDITDANDALTDSITKDGGVIDAIESELDQVSELTGKYANLRQQIQGLIADHETLMVRIGNEPNPYTPPGTGTSGSSSSSSSGSGNGSGSGSSSSGGSSSGSGQGSSTASTPSGTGTSEANAPEYSDLTKQGVALAIWNGGFGWGSGTTRRNRLDEKGFDPDEIQRIIDATNPNGNWRDRYGISDLNKYSYSSFDTGGYTGAWGSYGKFAMLHEKELILNPGETENFLASMEVLRSIIKMIDLQSTASQLGGLLHSPGYLAPNASDTLEQNVHIEASFPEVHDRYEIEAALTSIVNRASQFANRK